MTLKQVSEALVFASPKPITTREIVNALKSAAEGSEDETRQALAKSKDADVIEALTAVQEELATTGRPFQLVEKVNGWTLVSTPDCAVWVRQLYPEAKPTRLTGPQLETLAIIAYRQPVTRADIEAVRGVAVDGVMQVLLDRGLVKIAGRAEVPGRPLLYSTSEYFLDHFGLKTTDELPNASELKRVPLPTAPAPEETPKPEKPEKPAKAGKAAKAAAAGEAAAAESPAAEVPAEGAAPFAEPAPVAEAAASAEPPAEEVPVETTEAEENRTHETHETHTSHEEEPPAPEAEPEPAEEPEPATEPAPASEPETPDEPSTDLATPENPD